MLGPGKRHIGAPPQSESQEVISESPCGAVVSRRNTMIVALHGQQAEISLWLDLDFPDHAAN